MGICDECGEEKGYILSDQGRRVCEPCCNQLKWERRRTKRARQRELTRAEILTALQGKNWRMGK